MYLAIFKLLLVLAQSKRGRRLALVAGLAALRVARSEEALRAYAFAGRRARSARPRRVANRSFGAGFRQVKKRRGRRKG